MKYYKYFLERLAWLDNKVTCFTGGSTLVLFLMLWLVLEKYFEEGGVIVMFAAMVVACALAVNFSFLRWKRNAENFKKGIGHERVAELRMSFADGDVFACQSILEDGEGAMSVPQYRKFYKWLFNKDGGSFFIMRARGCDQMINRHLINTFSIKIFQRDCCDEKSKWVES